MNAQVSLPPSSKASVDNPGTAKISTFVVALLLGSTVGAHALASDASVAKRELDNQLVHHQPDNRALLEVGEKPALNEPDVPVQKGPNSSQYITIVGSEFRPTSSAPDFFVPSHASLACRQTSTNSLAEAQLQLPDGATIQALRVYGVDSTEQDMSVGIVERCQPVASAGNVVPKRLATVTSSQTPHRFTQGTIVAGAPTVDNLQCSYTLRLQLSSVVGGCALGTMQLDKVRVQWLK